MKAPGAKGFPRLVAAFRNSKAGLSDMWQREEAFRIELVLFLAAIPGSFAIGQSVGHIGLLLGSLLLLLIVEILNSSIDATVDRIGAERHELSRIAKDTASLAVLLTALIPTVVWGATALNWLGLVTF